MTPDPPLADSIVARVDAILADAERSVRPVEIDPYRGQLFELFVTAEAAGFLGALAEREGEPDLSADGLCRRLGERWGLADSLRGSVAKQEKLPADQMARMRVLSGVLRMWMEWQYAWDRWPEFHDG